MSVMVRTAFKEWAIVVDALGRGDQIVILRKGGIFEGRGGFQVEHSRFWLFPTLYHQQREAIITAAQARFDEVASTWPCPEVARLEFWAEVVSWRRVDSLELAMRLRGQHIWRDEVIAERFEWGRSNDIFAMAARVHRASPIELPVLPEYGGCKSWIELDRDIADSGPRPVLDEASFDEKLKRFCAAIEA